jgi:carbon starvation protein
VGFAQIFTGIPGMRGFMSFWYHFAIMFEALFILTTIDAGTRVSRFLVQEFVGKLWKPFERTNWVPGAVLSTAFIVFAWAYFIWTGNISTIWPMFGTANQLLAGVALAVATSAILNAGKSRFAWVTLLPMAFVMATTLTACWLNITDNFLPMLQNVQTEIQGFINIILTVVIMGCAVIVLIEALRKWYRVLIKKEYRIAGEIVYATDKNFTPPNFGCC